MLKNNVIRAFRELDVGENCVLKKNGFTIRINESNAI